MKLLQKISETDLVSVARGTASQELAARVHEAISGDAELLRAYHDWRGIVGVIGRDSGADQTVASIMHAVRSASVAVPSRARGWDRPLAWTLAAAGCIVLLAALGGDAMRWVSNLPAAGGVVTSAQRSVIEGMGNPSDAQMLLAGSSLPTRMRVAMTADNSALLAGGDGGVQLDTPMRLSVAEGKLLIEKSRN